MDRRKGRSLASVDGLSARDVGERIGNYSRFCTLNFPYVASREICAYFRTISYNRGSLICVTNVTNLVVFHVMTRGRVVIWRLLSLTNVLETRPFCMRTLSGGAPRW